MFDRRPALDVVFVPWRGVDPDKGIELGAAWLREQPGQGLVLLHAKKMYRNNPRLPALTSGAIVETPDTAWRSGWGGGPILAPWPSEEVLGSLSDQFAAKATSICVVEWGEKAFQTAWLRAHGARNLVSGEPHAGSSDDLLTPTVRVAMTHLSLAVNHNNALVQGYEKSYAVRTLQELHRAGHHIDVDNLCAWALANGFSQVEVKHLRDYAQRVVAGRSFRLPESGGPTRGSAAKWEEEANQERRDTRGDAPT